MTVEKVFAYLAEDFGQGFASDPIAAAEVTSGLAVTVARGVTPVEIGLSGSVLTAPLNLGGHSFAAGDAAPSLWTLVDTTKGVRLTAHRMTAAAGDAACVAIVSALPLKPGQTYHLTLSAAAEPGFIGGMAAGTRLLTEGGKRPIEDISPGEKVWTEAAGFQPVLWHGVQTRLARGPVAPLRLRRGLLGLSRDLLLAATQCVRVETGGGPVLIPAAAFERAGMAVREVGPMLTWHQLLLPGHAVIFAHGLPCESLWAPSLPQAGRPADWPEGYATPPAPVYPRLSEEDGARVLGGEDVPDQVGP